MGGGGGAAQAPNLNASQVSADQTKANVNSAVSQARLNNTNQVTPYGNLNYNETGGQYDFNGNWIPQFTATQTLSPTEQALFDSSTRLQGQGNDLASQYLSTASSLLPRLQSVLTSGIDYSNLQPIAAPASQNQSDYENKAYDALTARSTQDINRQSEAQKVQLANQGLSPGTDAYNAALQPFERATVDASNQATINASQLAGQKIAQQGQVMSQDQMLRNQQITELLQQHNLPIQDLTALLGFSTSTPNGGPQQPNYAPSVNAPVAPTDTTGPQIAAYQGQVANYNQQLQAQNATTGGLFGLGGSLLGGLARAPGVQSFLGLGAAA